MMLVDTKDGGKLKDLADICIRVPETETFKVQELHLVLQLPRAVFVVGQDGQQLVGVR